VVVRASSFICVGSGAPGGAAGAANANVLAP